MTLQNDFILFGSAASNIDSQATYAAASTTSGGRSSGVFPSSTFNKIARQGSWSSALIGQLLNWAGYNAVDDGTTTTYETNFQNAIAAAALNQTPLSPGGRLSLVSGQLIETSDQVSSTVVYYNAAPNNHVPVWNGTNWTVLRYATPLALSLTSAAASNSIVDVFGFNNSGVVTLGFGPTWATTSGRGSGAGTTAITKLNNYLWTNANTITLLNGANTYTGIAVNQATYLGSLLIDSTAGQISVYTTPGQNRKCGVFNQYNKVKRTLIAQDTTASWAYSTAAWRASNANTGNTVSFLNGLDETFFDAEFTQLMQLGSVSGAVNSSINNAVYINSSPGSGMNGTLSLNTSATTGPVVGHTTKATVTGNALGLIQAQAYEFGGTTGTFYGTNNMYLAAYFWA